MNLKQDIESVMRSEKNSRTGSLGSFLFALSLLYGSIVRSREFFYRKNILQSQKLPCKVISVGNLTVGGTGKTPMTIHLARRLSRQGYKIVVLSRGYKGASEKIGGIVSDGQTLLMNPAQAGDEPFMMARNLKHIPVIVGQNRVKAGWLAIEKFAPDVIVLDDAFQHLKLARDMNLVLLDYQTPFGNTCLLPRGILREPMSALARADAFVLTRCDAIRSAKIERSGFSHIFLKKIIGNRPVFKSIHSPYISELITAESRTSRAGLKPALQGRSSKAGLEPALQEISSRAGLKPALQGRTGFVFSGIAGNRDFRHTVETLGCNIAGFSEFADHHRYSEKEIEIIINSAYRTKADMLVTTEKDYVRIPPETRWPLDLAVLGIEISFGAEDQAFGQFIEKVRSEK